jgi:hypothetical protein
VTTAGSRLLSPADGAFERFCAFVKENALFHSGSEDLSEADTRAKLIDPVTAAVGRGGDSRQEGGLLVEQQSRPDSESPRTVTHSQESDGQPSDSADDA